MENFTFDTLAQGWNQIRMSGAQNLKAAVSGLTDPSYIIIQRVGESPETLTVMFKGFDQALANPERDGPILKRSLFAWLRNFGEAQIVRGDPQTFTVMLRKPAQQAQAPMEVPPQQMPESVNNGELVRISRVRMLNAKTA